MDKVIVHCSDSPQGRGDDAETIHYWHRARSWSGIGYHHVILEDGEIQPGRPEYWTGAHVKGHNSNTIGVCLIGEDEFTDEQMDSLYYLICELIGRYPGIEVYGHNKLDSGKTCPNFDAPAWFDGRQGT